MKELWSETQRVLSARRDIPLFVFCLCVAGLGLFALHPASSLQARIETGDADFYFKKQLFFAMIGVCGMFFFTFFPLEAMRKLALPSLLVSIVLLGLVFVPGVGHKVSSRSESFHRWLDLGIVRFQPSEFAKISLVLYAAHILGRINVSSAQVDFRRLFWPFGIIALALVLIVLGPQYGTTLCIVSVLAVMIFLSGFPLKQILVISLASLPLAFIGALLWEYRFERLRVWLDPFAFRHEGGYQLVTSFRAFQEGGLAGQELGTGFAHRYLTYGHTDFILPLFAEDFGLAGIVVLFAVYLAFIWRSIHLLRFVQIPFYFMAGAGALVMILMQTLLNIAVVTGLLPTTGVSLPFFSYGGSSLIASFCLVGILLNASAQSEIVSSP